MSWNYLYTSRLSFELFVASSEKRNKKSLKKHRWVACFTKIIQYVPGIILLHFVLNTFHLIWSTFRNRLSYIPSTNILLFVSAVKEETTYCDDNLDLLLTTCYGTSITRLLSSVTMDVLSSSGPGMPLPRGRHHICHRGHLSVLSSSTTSPVPIEAIPPTSQIKWF